MADTVIRASIRIRRQREDVIAFVSDWRNDPVWQHAVWETIPLNDDASPRVGAEYLVKTKFLGRIIEQTWRVVERADDGASWCSRTIAGPLPMQLRVRFTVCDQGVTCVEREVEMDVRPFFKLPQHVVHSIAEHALALDFHNLKAILEELTPSDSS